MVQLQLFKDRLPPSTTPSVEAVRARLNDVLTLLREADKLPWTKAELRHWRTVTPQMANWLSPKERDAAKRTFAAELTRLGVKADQAK